VTNIAAIYLKMNDKEDKKPVKNEVEIAEKMLVDESGPD
jgi:hypothetical protein